MNINKWFYLRTSHLDWAPFNTWRNVKRSFAKEMLTVCLQMELQATGPSIPTVIQDENGNVIDSRQEGSEPIQFVFEEINWTSEIHREEATRNIEVTFYPFKKVCLDEIYCIFVTHWTPNKSRKCTADTREDSFLSLLYIFSDCFVFFMAVYCVLHQMSCFYPTSGFIFAFHWGLQQSPGGEEAGPLRTSLGCSGWPVLLR